MLVLSDPPFQDVFPAAESVSDWCAPLKGGNMLISILSKLWYDGWMYPIIILGSVVWSVLARRPEPFVGVGLPAAVFSIAFYFLKRDLKL